MSSLNSRRGIQAVLHGTTMDRYQVPLDIHERMSEPLGHNRVQDGVHDGVEVVAHSLKWKKILYCLELFLISTSH